MLKSSKSKSRGTIKYRKEYYEKKGHGIEKIKKKREVGAWIN